jgi:radical SAM protein with 4Fe4S-binding SPASM domain
VTETLTEYGSLVREMLRRAAKDRQPAHGAFELTSRCNLSCRMCYVRQAAGDKTAKAKELPTSAWLELARQAVDNGMVFLLLTGGEVLLRHDFFEIYEPLTRMGLVLALFTNGTLITKDFAARLAQAPPSRTEITLYGATAATYEAVTGMPGSFVACCAGIEALVSHRIPLGLKTTITRQNVGELEAMRQMAHDWSVPFSAGWLLSGRPDRTPSDVEDCRLSAADCITLEMTDHASAHEWIEAALRETAADLLNSFSCHAGKAAFVINPVGEMNVCLILPQPAARPLETGFSEAWKQLQQYVDSAPPVVSECRACDALPYCGRCAAWSMMETGTLTDPVPYLCEIARVRKERYEQPA